MDKALATFTVTFLTMSALVPPVEAQVYDDLKCYKIKDAAKFRATVDLDALDAAFPDDSCSVVGKGKFFCIPSASDVRTFEDRSRDGIPQVPFEGEELADARICYKVKCEENDPADRTATDAFGSRTLSKFKLKMLCTPARDGVPPTTTTTTLPPAPKRIFVTSGGFTALLGGLAGADAECNDAAAAASLGGTWMAWLSDTSDGPATRFPTQSALGYELVDGTTIANDWADLVDGTLQAAINKDEYGATVGFTEVWTNTREDGTPFCTSPQTTCDCLGWTSDLGTINGRTGGVGSPGYPWTRYASLACRTVGVRLYCFEQ